MYINISFLYIYHNIHMNWIELYIKKLYIEINIRKQLISSTSHLQNYKNDTAVAQHKHKLFS